MTQTVELLAKRRQKSESYRAIQACNDYLRMGPTRSLRGLANDSKSEQKRADRRPAGTLMRWSTRYDWQNRAEEYDAQVDAAKTARTQEIMRSGLALDHERVAELKYLAALLRAGLIGISSRRSSRELLRPDHHPAVRRTPETRTEDSARTDPGLDSSMER